MHKQAVWAIGLMTGTALDGYVDAALVKTDGEKIFELGDFILFPYDNYKREILAKAVNAALKWNFEGEKPIIFQEAEEIITQIYCEAVHAILKKSNMKAQDIAYIGGHGLTLLHRPPEDGKIGQSLQILNGNKLAIMCDIDVIYDFRSNDIANGGQGAPLAPIYHKALLEFAGLKQPNAFLNLGGVANITYISKDGELAAFDCGPANGPLNELIENNNLGTYDKDGLIALKGKTDEALINSIITRPWFKQTYPKSLDRYDYSAKLVENLNINDGAATLCALIGACVDKAFYLLPQIPKTIVLAGGGRKNPVIVNEIEGRAKIVTIDADELGLRGDAIEAECFAFLAIRSANGLPISFKGTTGVEKPIKGGKIAYK